MVKGLYTAYTGMINEQKRLDVLSNNLANADTNGYKKEGTTSQTFADELAIKIKDTSSYGLAQKLGTISMGVHIGETYTDYSTGSFKVTDNSTDFAIKGDGFLRLPTRISRKFIRKIYKGRSVHGQHPGLSGDQGRRLCPECK